MSKIRQHRALIRGLWLALGLCTACAAEHPQPAPPNHGASFALYPAAGTFDVRRGAVLVVDKAMAEVLFSDATAGASFLDAQRLSWAGCSNRELRYAQPMVGDQVWAVGPTRADRNTLTVSREQSSPQHWFCQRALSVHAGVGVDVEACSLDGPTSAAAEIARRIGDRLPSA